MSPTSRRTKLPGHPGSPPLPDPGQPAADEGGALFVDMSERLRLAQQLLRSLDADAELKVSLAQRLIAITNSAKHDLGTASERLDALMPELLNEK